MILTLFVIGGVGMMVDLNTNYEDEGVNISTEKYGSIYNTTDRIFNLSKSADEKAFQGEIAEVESADATIRGAYSVIRLISGVYNLFWGVINAVADELGVPAIFVTTAYITFVLTIVFSLVYLVFRFIPR